MRGGVRPGPGPIHAMLQQYMLHYVLIKELAFVAIPWRWWCSAEREGGGESVLGEMPTAMALETG